MNQDQLDLYREILPMQKQRLENMKRQRTNKTNFLSKIWHNYQINKLENYVEYVEKIVGKNR